MKDRGKRISLIAWALALAFTAAPVFFGCQSALARENADDLVEEGIVLYREAKENESIKGLVRAKSDYFFRAQQMEPSNETAKRYIIEIDKEIFRLRKKKKREKKKILELARQKKRSGDFYESVIEYKRLLEIDPRNTEARLYLDANEEKARRYTRRYVDQGIYLVEKGRVDEGLEYLDKVGAVDPDNRKAARFRKNKMEELLKKAESAYRRGRIMEAKKRLRLALRFETSKEAVRLRRKLDVGRISKRLLSEARAQMDAGEWLEARKTLLKYRRVNPRSGAEKEPLSLVSSKIKEIARESVERGVILYQAGRLEKALKMFNKALRYDPENPTAKQYKERAEAKLEALQNI